MFWQHDFSCVCEVELLSLSFTRKKTQKRNNDLQAVAIVVFSALPAIQQLLNKRAQKLRSDLLRER